MTAACLALALVLVGTPGKADKQIKPPLSKAGAQMARVTAYCHLCSDGGGPRTRTEEPVGEGGVSADPRFWGPGSLVMFLVEGKWTTRRVNDTGGAIHGPWRFDLGFGNHRMCNKLGGSVPMRVIKRLSPIPVRKWPNLGKRRPTRGRRR